MRKKFAILLMLLLLASFSQMDAQIHQIPDATPKKEKKANPKREKEQSQRDSSKSSSKKNQKSKSEGKLQGSTKKKGTQGRTEKATVKENGKKEPTTDYKDLSKTNQKSKPRQTSKMNQKQKERIIQNAVNDMVYVEGDTFIMGATYEQGSGAHQDEKPTHKVTLPSYFIGRYEVTQELWLAVMDDNPSHFTGNLNLPVENVSWEDCQIFISKLIQITGKKFRLPSEAEWEYAARGGKYCLRYKYAGSNNISLVAWFNNNSNATTHAVGTKSPNELGLYDMSGNVQEWCQDWYGNYSNDSQIIPKGPSSGIVRVIRGGSWDLDDWTSRVSHRGYNSSTYSDKQVGLRLAL